MHKVRRAFVTLFHFGSWGLALYLFFSGEVAGGFGCLALSVLSGFGVGFGQEFASRYGHEALDKAKAEGRREAMREFSKGA